MDKSKSDSRIGKTKTFKIPIEIYATPVTGHWRG